MQTIKTNKITAYFLLLMGWILVYIGHNYIVPNAKIPILIAIADPATHGLVSLLLISPFIYFKKIDFKIGLFAISLGVLIDIDHIIAARSFDPAAMVALLERPISHSVLFSILFSLLFSFILKSDNKFFVFYLCFISLICHVFRDAIDSNNTPWAYPFYSYPIPQSLFMVVFGVVSVGHLWWSMKGE
jgi:membrane-bound metal-dependent hydrolase YbcI (DUF457 family)